MHYLFSDNFVNQPLHVSGIFVAHHQEVYCIYRTIGTCCIIYSIPPGDGLQICSEHVEVELQNKLRIQSALSWFVVHKHIQTHGQQNIQTVYNVCNNYNLLIICNKHSCKHLTFANFIDFVTSVDVRKDSLKIMSIQRNMSEYLRNKHYC